MDRIDRRRSALVCEQLESRFVLSSFGPTQAPDAESIADPGGHLAVIVAGDPNGTPADSPANRIDANALASPFAGVGSLQITANRGTFICTATPIDTTHVLTAAHCVDLNNDGKSDKKDGIRNVTFNLNLDIDAATDQVDARISATSWEINPDFTGFNHPSVNDDLAVITLGGGGVPAGVPTYSLSTSDMVAGTTHLYLVGYGRSGDGLNGYTTNASFTIKRHGENMVDAFYTQEDIGKPAANEVFRFDFDGATGNGSLGGPTLGNDKETTLGGGDSGGPSFVLCAGCDPTLASSYQLAAVNTFTQGTSAPKFGSLGGGINVYPYESWILGLHSTSDSGGAPGGNGGGSRHMIGNEMTLALIVPRNDGSTETTPAPMSSNTNDVFENRPIAPYSQDLNVAGTAPSELVPIATSVTASSDPAIHVKASASADKWSNTLDAVLEDWALMLHS